MIPGLENAEFLRYGVMHKNTFFNSPSILNSADLSCKKSGELYIAGQITGVEGYCESAASGLYTAYSIWAKHNNREVFLPSDTMMGALQRYTITENKNYQPMASNFGLITAQIETPRKVKGADKKEFQANHALKRMELFLSVNSTSTALTDGDINNSI